MITENMEARKKIRHKEYKSIDFRSLLGQEIIYIGFDKDAQFIGGRS